MASTDARMIFLVRARDEATKDLKRIERQIGDLSKTASGKPIDVQVGVGSLDKLNSLMGLLSGGLLAGLGLGAAAGLANMGVEMAKSAASADLLGASFNQLATQAGQSSQQMLEALRRASAGTISNRDLMLAANRAMLLGVASTSDEMVKLMEIARVRAAAMGLSTTQAFDNIVTGIGRASPLILDNLGIVIDAAEANAAYAARIGKTAEALTEAEKKQALLNAVLDQSSTYMDGAAMAAQANVDAFARWDATSKNLADTFGRVLLPAITNVVDAATSGLDAIGQLGAIASGELPAALNSLSETSAAIARARAEIQEFRRTFAERIAGGDQQVLFQLAGMEDNLRMLEQARAQLMETGTAAQAASAEYVSLSDQVRGLSGSMSAAAPAIDDVTASLLNQARAAREAVATLQTAQAGALRSTLLGLAGDLGAGAAQATYQDLTGQLAERTRLMQDWGYDVERIEFENQAWIQQTTGKIRDQIKAIEDESTAIRGMGSAAGSAQRDFDSLQSKIAGVLSESLDPGVGVNPADFLPREDAINENARRLADIAVNGWNSPWVEYFKQQFPAIFAELGEEGDIQAGAARILQRFQAGLRPELLDREKVKERVRMMLMGEASMAQLAQELAQELSAELGVSLPQAQQAAAAALGVRSTGQGEIGDAMDGGAVAETFTSGFVLAIGQMSARFYGAGSSAGGQWGSGFLATVGDSVPSALIGLLVGLVTPGVMAQMATATTQTEAQ